MRDKFDTVPADRKKKTICIISNRGGGGHESVAAALSEILEQNIAFRPIRCYLGDFSGPFRGTFSGFYDRLIGERNLIFARLFMKSFTIINHFNEYTYSLLGIADRFKKYLFEQNVAAVISVVPFENTFLINVLQSMTKTTIPLIIVPTDIKNLYSHWTPANADRFIAQTRTTYEVLQARGITKTNICCSGILLRQQFFKEISGEKTRDNGNPHILVMYGNAGSERVIEIIETIRKISRPVKLTVICGKSAKLREHLHGKDKSDPNLEIYGHVDDIASLLAECDIIITKPGGVTILEAIAARRRLLLDLRQPPLWHELGNAEYVVSNGFGSSFRRLDELLKELETDFPRAGNPYKNIDICYGHLSERLIEEITKTIANRSGSPFGQKESG